MNPYSEIIERLITLKDMHRGELELSEQIGRASCRERVFILV